MPVPARRIDAAGRVVGNAWDGQGVHFGTAPDYVRGYTWDGPGSDAVVLTPVTTSTSHTWGMNDLGDAVGTSWIPNDDFTSYPDDHQIPTLWEFDEQDEIVATYLQAEIPDRPSWFLLGAWDVTNDGWVSAFGRARVKGEYIWRAVLLEPFQN